MQTETFYSNMSNVFNLTNQYQYEEGLNWYAQAREYAKQISQESGVPFISTCAVISALSPMSPWERNKLDAYELVMGNQEHRFVTFGANVRKATDLLTMTNYDDIILKLNGLKTIAFFDNIFNEESEHTTIDSHMVAIVSGRKLSKKERPNLTDNRYRIISDNLKLLAEKNNLRPYEMQAILWVTWREIV